MVAKLLLLLKLLVVSGFQTSLFNEEYGEALVSFESFISRFNKSYGNPAEKMKRFGIFLENLEKIKEFNEKDSHATHAVNEFSDLSFEEFHYFYTGALPGLGDGNCVEETTPQGNNAPEQLDWNSQGIVTPVKSQQTCGSCWAFAVTGVVESKYAAKYQQTVDLSEQELLDCDNDQANGCDGGNPGLAFSKLIDLGGQVSESDYPYENAQGSCRFDKNKVVARLSACKSYNMNEDGLKQALYEDGPMVVIIDATNLKNYDGGIFESLCTTSTAHLHAVVLVGYGTENGNPYWLIKNSWGANWGNSGYFKLARGSNACLIGNPNYQSSGDLA